jgi:multidrug efflux system membrane fusion protein
MAPSIPTKRTHLTASRLAVGIAVAAMIAGGYLTWQAPAQATAPAAAPAAVPVSVAAVIERQVVQWDAFSGRLEAVGGVDVRSRVAGTIESIHFAPGALVNKGETLIVIDPKPFAAEVARAEAAVAAAQARLALTASELTRAKALLEDRAVSQREFDERSNAQREAQAALQGAQAALDVARLNLGYTRITAPIAGRVSRAEVTVGNLVPGGAGGPVLTSIVSVSPIYATFEADERTYLKYANGGGLRTVQKQLPIQLGLANEDGYPRIGQVEFIDNKLDPQSGTIRLRAVFDNRDGRLTPGLFARLRMSSADDARALLVTDRAIGTDQHKKFVYVVGDDNKVEYREVKLGPNTDAGLRVVQEGLSAGERIVVNGLQRVRPGAVVAPQLLAMDAKAPPATAAKSGAANESRS